MKIFIYSHSSENWLSFCIQNYYLNFSFYVRFLFVLKTDKMEKKKDDISLSLNLKHFQWLNDFSGWACVWLLPSLSSLFSNYFNRICLHFGWGSCKTSQNITFPSYVNTRFKSTQPDQCITIIFYFVILHTIQSVSIVTLHIRYNALPNLWLLLVKVIGGYLFTFSPSFNSICARF